MNRKLLFVITWVLFLGGLFGLGAALVGYFGDAEPVEFGILGIGGGFWLLSAAITILIDSRLGE